MVSCQMLPNMTVPQSPFIFMFLFVYHKALLRQLSSKVLNGIQRYCKSIAFKSWKLDTLWWKTAWLKTKSQLSADSSQQLYHLLHTSPRTPCIAFTKSLGKQWLQFTDSSSKCLWLDYIKPYGAFENTSSGLSADGVQAHITTGGLLGSFPANTSSRSLGAHTLAFLNSK